MVHPARSTAVTSALQATWDPERRMLLWSAGGDLSEALGEIPGLTAEHGMIFEQEVVSLNVRVVRGTVSALHLELDAALTLLAGLPADADSSDSVRVFSLASKLALELAARQRVIPTAIRGEARWRALLSRRQDRARAQALIEALPPAGRCVPVPGRPLRVRSSEDVVRGFLDAAVDHLYRQRAYPGPSRGWIRAWADGLRDDTASFAPRDARWAAMPGRIAQWAAAAEDPSPRVGFSLELPKTKNGSFALRLLLHAPGDPSSAIALTQGFSAGSSVSIGSGTFPRPAEAAVRGLARASRHYEPLQATLRGATPLDLSLDAAGVWDFLDRGRPALEAAGFPVQLPEAFREAGRQRIHARIRLGAPHGDLQGQLTYRWEVLIGDRVLSGDEFTELLSIGQPIVSWRGSWVFLDPAELGRLPDDLTTEGTLHLPDALRAVLTGTHDGVTVVADEGLTMLLDALREPPVVPAPDRLNAALRPYQARGFSWLSTLGTLGLGALLADDMGLGKTLQLIAHLLQRADAGRGEPRPHLVVCPTSVLGNWQREIARFAPALEVLRWHGQNRADEPLEDIDVVLTTYGLLVRDADLLAQLEWDVVALDEAQSIKNPDSQRAHAARRLQARHRVALTGTPVENRLDELWSVMEFLVSGLLGPRRRFQREVAVPIERFGDDDAANRLRLTVAPFMLRRVKTDPNVIDDLPDKLERREYCALTSEQRALYQAEVDQAMEEIRSASDMERRGRVLAMITALKQICNHPVQFLKREEGPIDPRLVGRSGKLDRLTDLAESIAACGERAVVFTQYREMGDLLQSHLGALLGDEIPFLHGGTPVTQRDEMVRRFQQDDWAPPVLIVSLRAGGTGLNLTRATHVIHYDRWWNPAVEDQATDRAYRIGQRKNVQVHKMVCEGTLEERIDALLEQKRQLSRTVVGTGERWVTELDDDQLRALVFLAGDGADA